jgi:FAD/FMN-containing dehydrogenase
LAFDDASGLVPVEAGASLADVEAALGERDLTLAMGTPSEAPVGEWLALGAPGAREQFADPVDQLVAGLSAVLADGRLVHIRPAPRRAVGPDLVAAFVGGRGRLGIITSAHLVARARTAETILTCRFEGAAEAASALAWMRGRGVRFVSSEIRIGDGGSAVLAIRLDGPDGVRRVRTAVARRIAESRGGSVVDDALPPSGSAPVAESRTTRVLAGALDPRRVLG